MKTELLRLRAAEVARLSDARKPFSSLFAASLHTLAKRQIGAARILARDLRLAAAIRTARDVRHVVGLSLFVMADRIVERIGRYYAQASLANIESGQARYRYNRDGSRRRRFVMPPEVAQVYEDSLKEYIDDVTNGLVRAQVRRRTVAWKVTLQARCCECGEWYTPTRGYQARCGKCARRSSSSKGRRMRRPYPNGDDPRTTVRRSYQSGDVSRTTVHGNDLVVIPDNGKTVGRLSKGRRMRHPHQSGDDSRTTVHGPDLAVIPDNGKTVGRLPKGRRMRRPYPNGDDPRTTAVKASRKSGEKDVQSNKARPGKKASTSKGSAAVPASRRGSVSSSKASNKKTGSKR